MFFKLFKRDNKDLQDLNKWLDDIERQRNEAMRNIEQIANVLKNMEEIEND